MAAEMLERDDLSVYVIAGVPKSFKRQLQEFVENAAKKDGGAILVGDELSEWLVARLKDQKRPGSQRTPASSALWRAYSALSAARYYLESESEEEERVRELRRRVEDLWREVSPMFEEPATEGEGAEGAEQ